MKITWNAVIVIFTTVITLIGLIGCPPAASPEAHPPRQEATNIGDGRVIYLTREEKEMVWHCFRYHQVTIQKEPIRPFDQCQGLVYDRIETQDARKDTQRYTDRQISIFEYRDAVENFYVHKQLPKIKDKFHDTYAKVLDCALDQRWRRKPFDECHPAVDGVDADASEEEKAKQTGNDVIVKEIVYGVWLTYHKTVREYRQRVVDLYQKEKLRARVEDCYTYHYGKDHYTGCKDISWADDHPDNQPFVPTNPVYTKIWNKLVQQSATTKQCRHWYEPIPDIEQEKLDKTTWCPANL